MRAFRRFVAEEEGGQALLLVLCFLIPMACAFGMVVRTDHAIVGRMQVQTAADASALAAGNMYARAMNQIAVNNLQITKIASMQAAMLSALVGDAAVFYKLFLAESWSINKNVSNDPMQNTGTGVDPQARQQADAAVKQADQAAVAAAQRTRDAQAALRRSEERFPRDVDARNATFAAQQNLQAAEREEQRAEQALRTAQSKQQQTTPSSGVKKERKWGEIGKTWNAFKCWRNVFKVAWPACRTAIQVAIAGAETIIIPILAAIVATVACPIAAIAVLCMVCEVVMLGEYLLITNWWAYESAYLIFHGYKISTEGTAVIRRLSDHSKSLIQELPTQMNAEMNRVAKMQGCEAAFLASDDNFRTGVDLDVSKTMVLGGLGDVMGLALYGFNGADWKDAVRFNLLNALPKVLQSGANRLWSATGATANREVFVQALGKKGVDVDWNAGMLYFEGPGPGLYKTTFPWSEVFKFFLGKRMKEGLEKNLDPNRPWTSLDFILSLLEIGRTTSKVLSTDSRVPRGPVLWYLQWITDVHFGIAEWFTDKDSLDQGHTPLGNPDTLYPTCWNVFHIGCDGNRTLFRFWEYFQGAQSNSAVGKLMDKIKNLVGPRVGRILTWIDQKVFQPLRTFKKWLNDKLGGSIGACQFLPCNPDWTTYSAPWAKMWADFAAMIVAPARFSAASGAIDGSRLYFLPKNGPQVDFIVAARRTNKQGFFGATFPSTGAFNDSNFWAAAKFRLYNPSEVHRLMDLVEPEGNSRIAKYYPENLMSQDWRAKLVPVLKDDLNGAPAASPQVLKRSRH